MKCTSSDVSSIDDIAHRRERWKSFMAADSAMPFMFQIGFPLPEAEAGRPPYAPLWPEKAAQRVEWAWGLYEIMCRKAILVNDDHVPYLCNVTGTEIFAEAFGCRVHRPDDTNPFALPRVRTPAEADAVKIPELSTSSLAYLFDIADELYRRGGPDAVMKLVDVQSPMDVTALIWNKADLFIAMLESPDAVRALAEKVRSLMVAFFDEWFRRYGRTYIAHCPHYPMHGGLTMSVDEVGAVSDHMFRAFFRDELVALSEHFGGIGIHCCADARHQWQNFRDLPGLKLINHFPPPTRDPRTYILDSLRFYGPKIAQMPCGWRPDGEMDTWPAQVPAGTRMVFEIWVDNAAQAADIADRMQECRAASVR